MICDECGQKVVVRSIETHYYDYATDEEGNFDYDEGPVVDADVFVNEMVALCGCYYCPYGVEEPTQTVYRRGE